MSNKHPHSISLKPKPNMRALFEGFRVTWWSAGFKKRGISEEVLWKGPGTDVVLINEIIQPMDDQEYIYNKLKNAAVNINGMLLLKLLIFYFVVRFI